MRYFIIFILIVWCFFSCWGPGRSVGPRTAKKVSRDFPRIYTGLDTLIRIDGYYYHENSIGEFCGPFMVSNNSEFRISNVQYNNHNQIWDVFRKGMLDGEGKGSYTLSGDTIKARWPMPYQIGCYDIFSHQYIIENDTTLRLIFGSYETCSGSKRDSVRNKIYKFHK